VRGIKGRDPPTGTTFLKGWQAFEEEISKIWQNARTYNEDGSDISELAGELEVDTFQSMVPHRVLICCQEYFYRRLTEAKRSVAEPPQPRVKLRMPAKSPEPSKITLKFGGQKGNSSAAMSVDNEALKRQQDLVRAGSNGNRPGSGSTKFLFHGFSVCLHAGIGVPSIQTGGSSDHAINGPKAEARHGMSPVLEAIQTNGVNDVRRSRSTANMHMPPPVRMPSESPHPKALTNGGGPTSHIAATPFNSRTRQPGKGKSCI